MKHLQSLFLILIWIGCTKSDDTSCSTFKKENISFEEDLEKRVKQNGLLLASYMNNLEKLDRFLLYCYEFKNEVLALITSADLSYRVIIKKLPCADRTSLTEMTYMYLRDGTFMQVQRTKYLVFGITAEGAKDWCRYDIGLDVKPVKIVKHFKENAPERDFWNWSESGIKIGTVTDKEYRLEDLNRRGRLMTDFVSDGEPKLVLNCYDDNKAILRSPAGQRIAQINDLECWNKKTYLQTFFVYTPSSDGSVYKHTQGGHGNLPWYDGEDQGKDRSETDLWLYYFTTLIGGGSNCYWKKVDVDIPNTCPSLPSDSMINSLADFKEIYENYKLHVVAKYVSDEDRGLILTCFKSEKDQVLRYYSVMTTISGKYLVSLNSIDCSSTDNFDGLLASRFTYGFHKPNFFLISKRSSISEEWCTYSMNKPDFAMEYAVANTIYQWVYYNHRPTGSWIKHSSRCFDFFQKVSPGGYKLSAAYEDFTPVRYIWVMEPELHVFFLHCHKDMDTSTGKEYYVGIFKTLTNEALFSIVGLDCWTELKSDEKQYMMLTIKDQRKHLSVGLRHPPQGEWCRFDVCVDCEDKTPILQLDGNPYGKFIPWTQAGVQWTRGLTKDYDYKTEKSNKYYSTIGKTQFILICITETDNMLRSVNGAFVVKLAPICDSWKEFDRLLFFVTEGFDGKLKLHTSQDCYNGCLVDEGDTIKETWLYYYKRDYSFKIKNSLFKYEFKEVEGENCKHLNEGRIKTKPEPPLRKKLLSEFRTGKKLNFKISCYVIEEDSTLVYYAEIMYKEDPLMTIDDFNCKEKQSIIDKLAVTTTLGDDDKRQVVISAQDNRKNDPWCAYNIMKMPDSDSYKIVRYYGYEPSYLELQWYENKPYQDCPVLKRANISVKEWKNDNGEVGKEVKTYVGHLDDEYIMLHCYEKSVSNKAFYTSVFTIMDKEGDISVTAEGLKCATKESLRLFLIFFWKSHGQNYMTLETKVNEIDQKGCRYDIDLDLKDPQVNLNLRTSLDKHVIKWSEAGITLKSRPSFLDTLTPIDDENNVIEETNLVKIYYSEKFIIPFILKCYKKDNKYFSVISSKRGLHFGTIPDYNCLDYRFHNVYLHFKIGNRIEFSGDLKKESTELKSGMLCWYHTCNTPNEPEERVEIFYFFQKYDKNDPMFKMINEMRLKAHKPSSSLDVKGYVNLIDTKKDLLLVISDWWTVEVSDEKYGQCSSLKRESIIQFETIKDRSQLTLVAKYVRKKSPKLELHCYIRVGEDKIEYFYTFANIFGNPMFSVTDHDCSPNSRGQPVSQLFAALDEEYNDDGKDFFFIGNSDCWLSVVHCPSCGTGVINTLHGYSPKDQYSWQLVPVTDCPNIKPTDIYKDPTFPLEEDPFEVCARYMNNYKEHDIGHYTLLCYCSLDGNDDRGFVTVLLSHKGEYLISIKGLDCFNGFNVVSPSYISLKKVEDKLTLVVGSRTVVKQSFGPWCLYETCVTCDDIQVSPAELDSEDPFQWSESGIKIERCPSRSRSAFGYDLKKSTVVAEYQGVLWQDCHKTQDFQGWLLQLKTQRGLFIMTIPLQKSCEDEKLNLVVREFYVHMSNDDEIFAMTSPNIEDLVQTCWNSGREVVPLDSWFYSFLGQNGVRKEGRKPYRKIENYEKNCPLIARKSISMKKNKEENMKNALKEEYWNGGEPKVKLTFYKMYSIDDKGITKDTYFATISSKGKKEVFKIDELNIMDNRFSMLDRVIYVDYDGDNDLIIGSRDKHAGDWCWFRVYYNDNKIGNVLRIDDHQRKHGTSQWYKGEKESCSLIKWEHISTEENKELTSQVPESIEIGYVHIEENTSNILKEVFVTYLYSKGAADKNGKKICSMMITNDQGKHLVTISEIECARSWTLYMFRYQEYQDYLVFGAVSESNNDICQYDICINCPEKTVQRNTHVPTDSEVKSIRWVKDYEKIAVDPPPRKSQSSKKFSDERVVKRFVCEKTPLFYIECHLTGPAHKSKNYGVLRTYTGLIIGTIEKKDCEDNAITDEIYLRYLLFKMSDGTASVHDLGITEPPEKGKDSCWFYGCGAGKIKEILLFSENVPLPPKRSVTNYVPGLWLLTITPSKPCPTLALPEDFNQLVNVKKSSVLKMYVNSNNYKIYCYLTGVTSGTLDYMSAIYDSKGAYVASLVDLDCTSINNLQYKIDVLMEENKNDVDIQLILVSPFGSCSHASYTICPECEKEKQLVIYRPNLKVYGDWKKVATEKCYSYSKENIITDKGEINLNGYDEDQIYINEDEKDENVFILRCFGNTARLDTLEGRHLVYLKNIDCSTKAKLDAVFYMSVIKTGGYQYIVVGTRSDEGGKYPPWCRYDVCTDCKNAEDRIKVNVDDDPDNLPILKWSTNVLEGKPKEGTYTTCKVNCIKNVNRKYPEYTSECRNVPPKRTSVIMRGDTPLAAAVDKDCFGRDVLFRTFYIYTFFRDSKYTLVRLGQAEETEPERLDNVVQKLVFIFTEKDVPTIKAWKEVTNPTVATRDVIQVDDFCAAKSRTRYDLKNQNFYESKNKLKPRK